MLADHHARPREDSRDFIGVELRRIVVLSTASEPERPKPGMGAAHLHGWRHPERLADQTHVVMNVVQGDRGAVISEFLLNAKTRRRMRPM
jgi:hypothetical protein